MKIKNWWKGLKEWQKVIILWIFVALGIVFVKCFLQKNTHTLSLILSVVLYLMFVGILIYFLNSSIKSNFVRKSAIIGGVIGFVFFIFVMFFGQNFKWIIEPMLYINNLIGCNKVCMGCMYMIFVYPVVITFLFALVFSIIAQIISEKKKSNVN